MRRSLSASLAFALGLFLAACADQPPERTPLAPSGPAPALSDQCAGSLGSTISKQQKDLFSGAALTDLQAQFAAIKKACPAISTATLLAYVESMIGYSGAPTNANRAGALADHLASVTLYVTATALVRPPVVFQNTGGAAVLSPGEVMTTWDSRARLEIANGTSPGGPHLFTFEPRPTAECGGTTTLRLSGGCYDVKDYPDETAIYTPAATITLCMRAEHFGPSGILHERPGYGGEILPPVNFTFPCAHTENAMNGWLGTEAGPLGRLVAATYDYLRPRPLFAEDAGESGSIGSFSLVGGALTVLFEDSFTANAPGPFLNGTDPEVGDFPSSWLVEVTHPGSISIQNGLGDLTGNVVVISQGQGACAQCPVVKLLGTRINPTPADTIGSYEVTWTSLQNKPNVKEAPFVVLSSTGAEIARLSYHTESSKNILRFNGDSVGTWVQNQAQDFSFIVNLTTLSGPSNSVTLSIDGGPPVTKLVPAATTLSTIGYVLTGIDAGIIAADNFRVRRLPDVP